MFNVIQTVYKVHTTATGKLILCYMADRASAEGSVGLTQSNIASACGVSVRVVNEYIARFKKAGILEITGRSPRRGSRVYKINLSSN
jgi:hypothetical protein